MCVRETVCETERVRETVREYGFNLDWNFYNCVWGSAILKWRLTLCFGIISENIGRKKIF